MNAKNATLAAAGIVLALLPASISAQRPQGPRPDPELQRMADQMQEALLKGIDPDLLQRAAKVGIYKYEEYPVLRSVNPFFMRGDFDGDGAVDLAVWVTQRSSGLRGVIVFLAKLGDVYYLGAGHGDGDLNGTGKRGEVYADAWQVLPLGTVVQAFDTVREIGAVAEKPFTVRRETLQFHWLGKSSFAFYWANGRFWHVWTGD